MTERREYVRVLLYGCSHKPKFTAMNCPKSGDTLLCHSCNRGRLVLGVETGWERALVRCKQCSWKHASQEQGKKVLLALAHKHADSRQHRVVVEHDGYESKVAPIRDRQIPLIDDLLLP